MGFSATPLPPAYHQMYAHSSKCCFLLCLFICLTHSEVTHGVVFDTASQISPLFTQISIFGHSF